MGTKMGTKNLCENEVNFGFAELRNRFPSRNHLSWSSLFYDGQKEQRIFPQLWLSTLPDYFTIKHLISVRKMVNLASFRKTNACGQTALPERSILLEQKLVENAKMASSNETFWMIFKQCVSQFLS